MENKIDVFGGVCIDIIQDSEIDLLLCAVANLQRFKGTRAHYNNMHKDNFLSLFLSGLN